MAFDPQVIEDKIDRAHAANMEIGGDSHGVSIKTMFDAQEVAKNVAIAKQALPAFMRGEVGLCLSAVMRSERWGLDPFFIADNMFIARLKGGEERIGFQAQLINAIVNMATARLLKGKLRCRYEGRQEDGSLKCIVYGTPKGEAEPLEYETPTLKTIIDHLGRNEYGKVKGSPLYDLDPKQQLFYYGSKAWTRKWYPEVIGGAYDPEDYAIAGGEMKDVTPGAEQITDKRTALVQRLQDRKQRHKRPRRGFDQNHVNTEVDKATGVVIEGSADRAAATGEKADGQKESGVAAGNDTGIQNEGRPADADSVGGPEQSGGGKGADVAAGGTEQGAAGGTQSQAEGDLFPPDRKGK